MSHMSGRALSDKEKIVSVFNKHSKTTQKNCCSVNSLTADCKCFNHHNKTDGQYKMKRLMSRKERSKMRGGGRETSKTKSHRHHFHRQSSKDMAHFHSCYCPSRRDAPFPNVIPAAQEASIITDSRLIGHHGLFNHEVKSIDIERLLSEQRKQEKSGQQVQEKNHVMSHLSSSPHNPSPFSSKDLLGADTNEAVPFEKKADPAKNADDDFWKKEKKIGQGSDVTPGQRPRQELDPSFGSCKSIFSSKHSSLDVVIIKSKKTNSVMSEKGRESQLSPTRDRENVITLNKKLKTHMTSTSTLEHTPKNQEPPIQQTQAHGLSPSPLQFSSSPITGSFDIQHKRQDPNCVSKSVTAMAARLCDYLHFPFLRRRNLVTESREVLLRALQERHGPRLQENLCKVQQHLSFGTDLTKAVQDEKLTVIDEDVLFPTDVSAFQANTAIQQYFDTWRTTSLKMTGSRHFNWSNLQPHKNLERTAEWLTSPVDTSASLLDDILRPSCSPQFCMDSEPPGVSSSDHLFSPSATSCWAEKASASQLWENSFNRPKSKESLMFDSFENRFINHTRAVRDSCAPQYSGSNVQTFFPHPAQLPDGRPAEPMHFPHEPEPFIIDSITDRYSYAPSSSAQIHHPNQSNHFQTFNQFSQSSTRPPVRSHHTDMVHYPPSHMLERNPAPPFCSFLSPEHWSFPPMRLY